MKSKIVLLLLIIAVCVPLKRASSQDTPVQDWQLAYNFDSSRLVGFVVQDGKATILLDETLFAMSITQAFRLGPQAALVFTEIETEVGGEAVFFVSPDGLRPIDAQWGNGDVLENTFPYFYSQSRLVLFQNVPVDQARMMVIGLEDEQVQIFEQVDYFGPHLSADGSKLRWVGRTPDTTDQWDVMEMDMATGAVTPLNILNLTSERMPFVGSDTYGEYWLVRSDRTTPPQLIGVDGSSATIDSPLEADQTIAGIRQGHVLQIDPACETECVTYVKTLGDGDWVAYPLPANGDVGVQDFYGDTLVMINNSQEVWAITPDASPEFLGYNSSNILYPTRPLSPDGTLLMVGEAENFPTTVHLHSLETNTTVLSFEANRMPLVWYGASEMLLNTDTGYQLYQGGQWLDLPTPDSDATRYRWQLLADGTLLASAHTSGTDGTTDQILIYDPQTGEPPSVLLDGLTLWPVLNLPVPMG